MTYDRLYKGQADVSTLFIKPVPYKLQLPKPFPPVPYDSRPTFDTQNMRSSITRRTTSPANSLLYQDR
jgi:hypothetical protein